MSPTAPLFLSVLLERSARSRYGPSHFIVSAWLGKGEHVRTKPLLWKTSSANSDASIRESQWKLIHPTRRNGAELALYDIVNDPSEKQNLVSKHPDIVKKLSAKVIGSLSDIQVRDFALGSHTSATQEIYWQMWRYLVRIAPPGFVAPVASLLAATSYEKGNGALAQRALDRAQGDDPNYSLATLLRRVFSAGWPPESFAQMRKELHPKVCAAIFDLQARSEKGAAVEKSEELA